MTPSHEFKHKVVDIIKTALRTVEPSGSCINCIWFSESSEICSKANARPPARVIVFGCESYEFDTIEF